MIHINRLAKVLMAASVIASTLILSLVGNSSVARAATITFQVTGGFTPEPSTGNGCNSSTFTDLFLPAVVYFSTSTSLNLNFSVAGVGTVEIYNRNFSAGFNVPNAYVFPTTTYSVGPHTLLTVTNTFYSGPNETGSILLTNSFQFDCTTGQLYQGPGPQVPGGFAMKQVTCNSPVYSQPGGSPVGSAQVTAGQRWYVNPTPVKDSTGKSWTELFTAGYTDGYIPTSCVNLGYNYVYGVN